MIAAVDRPLNVLALPGMPSVSDLASVGVARISVGGGFAFAALGALVEAACELRDGGTYGFWERAGAGAGAAEVACTRVHAVPGPPEDRRSAAADPQAQRPCRGALAARRQPRGVGRVPDLQAAVLLAADRLVVGQAAFGPWLGEAVSVARGRGGGVMFDQLDGADARAAAAPELPAEGRRSPAVQAAGPRDLAPVKRV